VDKYKPDSIEKIIDNNKNIQDIMNWLSNWYNNDKHEKTWKKSIVISGSPGFNFFFFFFIIIKKVLGKQGILLINL
jgi:hypothetical protein